MLLQELIDTFEELKKYVYIVDRGNKGRLIIKFNNDNFYHLVGLHKTNIDMFFPSCIKSKDKKYKYLKSHVEKFNNILLNQIQEKTSLQYRINTFVNIIDLLRSNENTTLYNLKNVTKDSLYNGDYGLLKIYEEIYCLFGLKCEYEKNDNYYCAPQSWMASNRINKLIENKVPIYMSNIASIPIYLYNNDDIVAMV